MKKYDHKKIEKKWQEKWEKDNIVKIDKDDTKKIFYMLDMFPYPSGDGLHMGHTESYTASDVYTRFKTMQGFNVLHPQGFDAFGLPAENFAIKTGIKPQVSTAQNISNFIRQMKSLGFRYDFDEKVVTYDPKYYKWTQWLFSKFFENDLVYKKTSKINWCESCQTGIANEQVVGGECERCGTQIVLKEIPGWFFKITNFADALIDDLDKIDWPEYTKKNQINWVGKSKGAKIVFKVKSQKSKVNEEIKVFTTRPDTLFGATYMVLSPEHKLIEELKERIENWDEIERYIIETQKKSEMERVEAKEKTGVEITGIKAINPANNKEIPIFVADYVLDGYGTGAIMAVPAHDERDYEFAKKYKIPVKEVVLPVLVDTIHPLREDKEDERRININVILFNPKNNKYAFLKWNTDLGWTTTIGGGLKENETYEEAGRRELLEETGYKNVKFIREVGNCIGKGFAKHKDINRISDVVGLYFELEDDEQVDVDEKEKKQHEVVWLTEKEIKSFLNVPTSVYIWKLFKNCNFVYLDKGELVNSGDFTGLDSEEAKQKITEFVGGELATNYRLRDWNVSRQRYWGCPIPVVYSPEGKAKLISEEHLPWLLPTDVDFVPTGESPLTKSKEFKERTEKIFGKGWTPEYDTMDTFVDSSWYFLRYPDANNNEEFCSESRKAWLPVDLYIGGAEHTYMHLLFSRFFVKAMKQIGLLNFDEPFMKLRHQGMVLDREGKKMSKSKGNIVNPDDMVERFGADAVRTYMLFVAPLEDEVMWNENNIIGVYRFLEKVWRYVDSWKVNYNEDNLTPEIIKLHNDERLDTNSNRELHKTIKKVTSDLEDLKYNTAISEMMKFINFIYKEKKINLGSLDGKEEFWVDLNKVGLETFLKILAPFAPHITEEIWESLGHTESIHLEEWPEHDQKLVKDEKHTIVVQVNGKVRSEMEIEDGEDEESVKEKALKGEKVQKWIEDKEIKKIIYIENKLVNIVV